MSARVSAVPGRPRIPPAASRGFEEICWQPPALQEVGGHVGKAALNPPISPQPPAAQGGGVERKPLAAGGRLRAAVFIAAPAEFHVTGALASWAGGAAQGQGDKGGATQPSSPTRPCGDSLVGSCGLEMRACTEAQVLSRSIECYCGDGDSGQRSLCSCYVPGAQLRVFIPYPKRSSQEVLAAVCSSNIRSRKSCLSGLIQVEVGCELGLFDWSATSLPAVPSGQSR